MPKSFYQKKEPKLINAKTITIAVIVVLLFVAHFTIPSEKHIKRTITSFVKSDIKKKSADNMATDEDADSMFYTYNSIEVIHHSLYAEVVLHNRYKTNNIISAIGLYGIVFPLIDWNEYIVTNGPVKHKYYHAGKKNPQETPWIGNKDCETGEIPNQ